MMFYLFLALLTIGLFAGALLIVWKVESIMQVFLLIALMLLYTYACLSLAV